jgi:hypothetical protein
MPSSDERTCACVTHCASDNSAACRTPGLRVLVLLLIALFLLRLRLLALSGLLALRLLLGRRRRWRRLR